MIGIIDYGCGNLKSITNALQKIRQKFRFLVKPAELNQVDKVILPGVGAAGYAMSNLKESDFIEVLRNLKLPCLGICLGMQILAQFSEEGEVDCLDIVPGKVQKFRGINIKVPQIGWNKVFIEKQTSLFDGICRTGYFYFVNSYYLPPNVGNLIAKACYGVEFAAAIQWENFYGVQFHPEKSGEVGLKLLSNFCNLC